MIKKHYLKEIKISATQSRGNKGKDVMKIQSWLNLFGRLNPGVGTATAIDGDFGPATELAVKNFQRANNLTENGLVDDNTFSVLSMPVANAFQTIPHAADLRELIIAIAHIHLDNNPYELTINNQTNSGPWVRSYMDNNEGMDWFWCMGFVQAIFDQALSSLNGNFKTLMPHSYSCDTVGSSALQKGLLTRVSEIRKDPTIAKPGDIFLLQLSPNDWIHTGIIAEVLQDIFVTIEGNTNEKGSRNGVGVYKRIRNFRETKLDVFSIEPVVN